MSEQHVLEELRLLEETQRIWRAKTLQGALRRGRVALDALPSLSPEGEGAARAIALAEAGISAANKAAGRGEGENAPRNFGASLLRAFRANWPVRPSVKRVEALRKQLLDLQRERLS
jgi:hypothetical protein